MHNIDKLMERTLEKNLDEYLENGTKNYKKIQSLITTMSNDWESRLKNQECSPAIKNKVIRRFYRLISDFLIQNIRFLIQSYFQVAYLIRDDWDTLNDEERHNIQVKLPMIPQQNKVRFRNTCDRLRIFLAWTYELQIIAETPENKYRRRHILKSSV